MIRVALVAALIAACGSKQTPSTSKVETPTFTSTADRVLPLLPEGAQVIVEVDLARLRANPVVGALVTQLVAGDVVAPLPGDVPPLSLAHADTMVMASYGVGTSSASTVIVLATTDKVANGIALADGLVVLGPAEWTAQVEARAAIAGVTGQNITPTIAAAKDLRDLRDHAMPDKAPGASLRITARLPFDARVALGRATGLDTPPAQLSVWGDVVDDMVFVVDLDAFDPGDTGKSKTKSSATKRMEASLRGMLGGLANETALKLVGLGPSLEGAQIVTKGTWVRAIIAIGPKRLVRIVERAKSLLAAPPPAEPVPADANAS